MNKKIFIILITLIFSCNYVFAEQIIPNEIQKITNTINAQKTGEKGKTYFYCKSGAKCSTEQIVREYYQNKGYKVIRGEVSFWQGMFALAYYDEIFSIYKEPYNDIPSDMFSENFYTNRKNIIDKKTEFLKSANIFNYINQQLTKNKNTETRLLTDAQIESYKNCIEYFQTPLVQEFLREISPKIFTKFVYRIAQNPSQNRAGTPDLIIWNDKTMIFVEVKREKETLRDGQIVWLEFLIKNKIQCRVTRVRATN